MYIYYDNKWSLIIKDSCVYISNKHFVTLKIKKTALNYLCIYMYIYHDKNGH